jgi:hypothetical protein
VFIAGVFHRDGWAPGVVDPDNAPPEFLARFYSEVSPDGAEHYPVVVAKLAQMHAGGPTLTAADLDEISSRIPVMIGDDDEVTLEHAIELYRSVPDGELAVIPGTSHGLLVEKPALSQRHDHRLPKGRPGAHHGTDPTGLARRNRCERSPSARVSLEFWTPVNGPVARST